MRMSMSMSMTISISIYYIYIHTYIYIYILVINVITPFDLRPSALKSGCALDLLPLEHLVLSLVCG